MAAGFEVDVVIEDGDDEVLQTTRIDGRDIRAWESAHDEAWPERQTRYSDIEWMAWNSLRRRGKVTVSYAAFQDVCVQASVREQEAVDPIRPAPTAG